MPWLPDDRVWMETSRPPALGKDLPMVGKTAHLDSIHPKLKSLYLRLSLTTECNLRCQYCRPRSGRIGKDRPRLLSDTELLDLVEAISEAKPIHKLRFTGGEPLLRPGLPGLIRDFKGILPHASLCLTTNGTLLKRSAYALKSAGLDSMNISLDTLDERRFQKLSRSHGLSRVLGGISAARRAGFRKVKLNTVLLRNYNYDQMESLIRVAASLLCEIRFVELMPLGQGAELFAKEFVSAKEALHRIKKVFPYLRSETSSSTAERHALDVDDRECIVGFITAVSHRFCGPCDRIRLDSFGTVYPCLRSEHGIDLCSHLRNKEYSLLKEKARSCLEEKNSMEASWPMRPMVQLGG